MLKLSERACHASSTEPVRRVHPTRPAWVRNPEPSARDLRLHWMAEQCVGPTADPGLATREAPDRRPRSVEDAIRRSPRWKRTRALVLTMARHRCADCGEQATDVVHLPGRLGSERIEDLKPVCDACHCSRSGHPANRCGGGPMGDAIAGVMARFAAPARSA